MQKTKPHIINTALLWEYDLDTFNYEKSYKIVIERILQMGNLEEWRNMVRLPLISSKILMKTLIRLSFCNRYR